MSDTSTSSGDQDQEDILGDGDNFSSTVGEMSINELMNKTGVTDQLIQHGIATIQEHRKDIQEASQAEQQNELTSAREAKTVSVEEQANAAAVQNTKIQFASHMGADPKSSTYILDGLADHLISVNQDIDNIQADLTAREKERSKSRFFNAISAVIPEIGEYARVQDLAQMRVLEKKKEEADTLGKQIQNINILVAQNNKNQADLTPALSNAAQAATSDLAARKYLTLANSAKLSGAIQDMDAVGKIMTASEATLGNSFQLHNAVAMQAQRDFQHQQALLIADQRRLLIEQRQQDLNAEQTMVSATQFGLGVLGKGNEATTLPPSKIMQLVKNGEFLEAYNIGMSKLANPNNPAKIANDPASSLGIIDKYNATLPLEMQPLIADMKSGVVTVANDPKNAGLKPVELQQKINTQILSQAAAHAANIKYQDASNPYQSFNLPTLMNVRGLQENAFISKVVNPLVKSGGLVENNPQQIYELAFKATQEGKINFNDAVVGIHLLYKTAANLNNIAKNYGAVGYPVQTGYNTHINLVGGGRQNFDLADTVSVNNLLATTFARNQNGPERQLFPMQERPKAPQSQIDLSTFTGVQ